MPAVVGGDEIKVPRPTLGRQPEKAEDLMQRRGLVRACARAVVVHEEASGEWRVGSGEWGVESEEWRVGSEEWRVGSEEWGVGSEQVGGGRCGKAEVVVEFDQDGRCPRGQGGVDLIPVGRGCCAPGEVTVVEVNPLLHQQIADRHHLEVVSAEEDNEFHWVGTDRGRRHAAQAAVFGLVRWSVAGE
jgi:hypothetical protein